MARSFTVTLLEQKARERADEVNSTRLGSAEVMRLISASWARLYMKIVKAYPEHYIASQDITTTGPTEALNATYFATHSVVQTIGTQKRELRNISMDEFAQYYHAGSPATVYMVQGNNLLLLPSGTGLTYTHFYLPVPVDLTAGTQSIDCEAGWEEYLVCDVAGRMVLKEEGDARPHFAERDRIEREIDKEVTLRDLRRRRPLRDVRDDEIGNSIDQRVGSWRDRLDY